MGQEEGIRARLQNLVVSKVGSMALGNGLGDERNLRPPYRDRRHCNWTCRNFNDPIRGHASRGTVHWWRRRRACCFYRASHSGMDGFRTAVMDSLLSQPVRVPAGERPSR